VDAWFAQVLAGHDGRRGYLYHFGGRPGTSPPWPRRGGLSNAAIEQLAALGLQPLRPASVSRERIRHGILGAALAGPNAPTSNLSQSTSRELVHRRLRLPPPSFTAAFVYRRLRLPPPSFTAEP
jgi:hypothetical protein